MRSACIVCVGLAACSPPKPSPEARYIAALQKRYEGDANAYHEDLIALACDSPTSRAGRRARAVLGGGDALASLALLGAAGAVLAPRPDRRALHARAEAQQALRSLAEAQASYRQQHGRFCPTFRDCGVHPAAATGYVFFLRDDELEGDRADPRAVAAARAALRDANVRPAVRADGFTAAAAGPNGSEPLEVWCIDEQGRLDAPPQR